MTEQQKSPAYPHHIAGGPSREELFDALRLQHKHGDVSFTLAYESLQIKVRASIRGIRSEDGSGDSWLLCLYNPHGLLGLTHLEAYYNTARRKGWMGPPRSNSG